MADGGPGPSTMASSPIVPGSARQLRVKRRVVNLVNPADPVDISEHGLSMDASAEKENIPVVDSREERKRTPSPRATVMPYTPSGINKDGVRGILRQTGTPGSGNGVRFFPKNKFRIITPNQSLNPPPRADATPLPTPQPPASPRGGSFLSQLLAVTIPSMSPRRAPAASVTVEEPSEEQSGPVDADESWEVPGQEGEISLVASSAASNRSLASEADETEPWAGTPEIHSSPLGLPTTVSETSLDNSQNLELPSREMQLPEDISDLMLQKLDRPSGMDSFSVSDFSRTNVRTGSLPPFELGVSTVREERSRKDDSHHRYLSADTSGMTSFSSFADRTDDNPTLQRPLSPLPAGASLSWSDPQTPPPAKAFTSIFADMSAEQAGLSWPLSAQASPQSEVGGDTAFHSAILPDMSTPSPISLPQVRAQAGNQKTPGDITQYFDCDSPSPVPVVPVLAKPSFTVSEASSLKTSGVPDLVSPARALFDAHSAHTSALGSELRLYRDLSTTLQAEVNERDSLLAMLNLRVIEGEVWRVRVDELEKQLKELKAAQQVPCRSQSLSPTPSRKSGPFEHAGDRTTVDQAAARDAEIRLAKSLADQEAMSKRMVELQNRLNGLTGEMADARSTIVHMEERERDVAMQNRRTADELKSQLDAVTQRERSLHAQLSQSRESLNEIDELKHHAEMLEDQIAERDIEIRQLQNFRADDEREIEQLTVRVEELSARVAGEDELITKLAEAETRAGEEKYVRKQVEKEMKALKRNTMEREEEVAELKRSLETTKTELLERLNAPSTISDGEVARLRAESASKDLEILNLQKRKNELKDDLEMLNIALDSKQQELELMKRKFSVRGVAGSTPLAPTRTLNVPATPAAGSEIETPAPGKYLNTRRRSSAAFVTPSMGSVRGHGKLLTGGHGTDGWKSATARKVLGKMEEENQPPKGERGSVRGSMKRERVLA